MHSPYDPLYEILRPFPIDGEQRFVRGDIVALTTSLQFIPEGTRGEVQGFAPEQERAKGRTYDVNFSLTVEQSRQWRDSVRQFAPRLVDMLADDTVSIRAAVHPDDLRLVSRVPSIDPELSLMAVKERRARRLIAAISGKPVRFHIRLLAPTLYQVLRTIGFVWDESRELWVNHHMDDSSSISVQLEGGEYV